jgi:hypothetical protein
MNIVDLNNTFKYDKIVINLNNENCLAFNTNKTDYYVNLVEPLKNVVYIKMLKASIKSTNAMDNQLSYEKFDPIHISINDYERSVSYIKGNKVSTSNYYLTNDDFANNVISILTTNTTVFDAAKYFDIIPYSGVSFSDVTYSQTSIDWSDPSVYILNPPDPNLRRLKIEFRDRTFKLFDTSVLTHFNLSICVYFIKNRV